MTPGGAEAAERDVGAGVAPRRPGGVLVLVFGIVAAAAWILVGERRPPPTAAPESDGLAASTSEAVLRLADEMRLRFGLAQRPTVLDAAPFAVVVPEGTLESPLHPRLAALARSLPPFARAVAAELPGTFPPFDDRLPVVLLADADAYLDYARRSGKGVATHQCAHFEAASGVVVASLAAREQDLLHEAVHALLARRRSVPPAPGAQALWLEEGVAEWAAGEGVADPAARPPRLDAGRLPLERLEALVRALERRAGTVPTLADLAARTLATRDHWVQTGDDDALDDTYAFGWALVHFLARVDLAPEDTVVLPEGPGPLANGRFRRLLDRMLELELDGQRGRPCHGVEALRVALAGEANAEQRIGAEFARYVHWLVRKQRAGHVDPARRRLLGWTEALRLGRSATAADDRLAPPPEPPK